LIPGWFQPTAALVLVFAYALSIAERPANARARHVLECAAIAAAAWLGEESCIRFYGFYGYASGWWPFFSSVPALVVAIWPMVVQSARAVVSELWPDAGRASRAGLVALVVLVDASLMEVVAVSSGLWSWSEPGYLGVPPIGMLGWAFFAGPLAFFLEGTGGGSGSGPKRVLASGLAAVLVTHALLLGAWWGLLRWLPRGDFGPGAVAGFAPLALVLLALVWRSGRRLHPATVAARVAAASVFFALVALRRDGPVLAHTALVAVPWVVASIRRPSRRGSVHGVG
jgi:hypothetical protein